MRSVPMKRDDVDTRKWVLAESVALGSPNAATGVIRFRDGTSEPLDPSLFASGVPIHAVDL